MRPELRTAIEAARTAGALTLKYYGGRFAVGDKGGGDPITAADLEADACLRRLLLEPYPGYGWLSEETADDPERLGRQRVWIVDPIDGTREFVGQIPEYVVSIALVEDGEPGVAVIYNPVRDELYAAVRRGGAFCNGKRVFCTQTGRLDQAILIASRSETQRGQTAPFLPYFKEVRPVGSVAYKLALVASGQADLNASVQPKNEWDVCAGDLLVREAGGQLLDLRGRQRRYNAACTLIEGGLVAGNAQLAQQLLRLIREFG
jgi:myo-inositol-1(or 4)-monophosphatase